MSDQTKNWMIPVSAMALFTIGLLFGSWLCGGSSKPEPEPAPAAKKKNLDLEIPVKVKVVEVITPDRSNEGWWYIVDRDDGLRCCISNSGFWGNEEVEGSEFYIAPRYLKRVTKIRVGKNLADIQPSLIELGESDEP